MLYYTAMVASRSHARRDTFVLTLDHAFKEKWLDEKSQKILERLHKLLRSGKSLDDAAQREYEDLVARKLAHVIGTE